MAKKFTYITVLSLLFTLFIFIDRPLFAADCPTGYKWNPDSGIDCQQIDCYSVTGAHYGSTGHCVCGSSGSIYEDPEDANVECSRAADYKSCPNCVYACVHKIEECTDASKSTEPDSKCVDYCKKFINKGGPLSEVTEVSGTYPKCNCTADIYDDKGILTSTIKFTDGDKKSTYTFDPDSGVLIKKETISLLEEREKIREQLGFKYSEEEIDKKVDPEKISKWFQNTTDHLTTKTSLLDGSYWTQHIMAILDHGFGNSADFVETYNYGRCGDSMLWLEQKLSAELGVQDKKHEAFVSITGENYGNITNHTAIMIRPKGVDNLAWAEAVNQLVNESGKKGSGLDSDKIKNIDPRILNAKVIDPYFKTETTVEKFIEGWSVIRIS